LKPNLFNLPFDNFRSDGVNQSEAIIRLVETRTRVVSLILPPGAGKTIIALAYGDFQGRTLFLTPTKHLHTQLEEYGVFSLHGHSHYKCWSNGECYDRDGCDYDRKMKLARNEKRVGTTYANWIGLNRRANEGFNPLGRFDLIVCDEAHNLPWIIADQMSFSISRELCENLVSTDLTAVQKYLRNILPSLTTDRQLNRERNAVETFLEDSSLNPDWLCKIDDHGLTCRVIWPNKFSRHVLIDCDKVLLMSATLSYQTLKYLNIPLSDNTFVELPTNFDSAMNPFIAIPIVAVQYDMSPKDCDTLVDFIDLVIQTRSTQGVIHSVSYEYAKMVLERSMYAASMISHRTSGTISGAIEEFVRKGRRVLISPSLSEGVSLEGDTCRWQIPIKVPYLNKMDLLTATRCAQDRAYEPFIVANQIQQQHGRGRRNINDYCETLMPDINWGGFYRRNKNFFMKWFNDTVRKASMLPPPLRPRRR
jgi:Rad3-related DNA helicase